MASSMSSKDETATAGPEYLVARYPHVGLHVHDDRRLVKCAFILTARRRSRPGADRLLDPRVDPYRVLAPHHGPHTDRSVELVSRCQPLHSIGKRVHEVAVDVAARHDARCAEMHTCPAFEKPLDTVPAMTLSMSASLITISGEFEPSSIVTFFSPAVLQMRSPTSRLPVKGDLPHPRIGHKWVADPTAGPGNALNRLGRSARLQEYLGKLQCRKGSIRLRA